MSDRIYSFHVSAVGLEDILNRDLELTGDSSIEDLAFAVLSTVGGDAGRRWKADIPGRTFEYPDLEGRDAIEPPDPIATTLDDLPLRPGRKIDITYDPNASWIFTAEVEDIREEEVPEKSAYPRVTGGTGAGIRVGLNPLEMKEAIDARRKGRSILTAHPREEEEEIYLKYGPMADKDWDYSTFDIEKANAVLQDDMAEMVDTAYLSGERPFN